MAHGIYSVIEGQGAPVVLVHGLGLDHAMWDALAVALALSRTVIRIDIRGHGRSDVGDGHYSLAQLTDNVVAVLDSYGVDATDFVGLSLGGMIGQGLALRYPSRVKKLVLACTTSAYPPEGPAMWQARIDAVEKGGLCAIAETAMQRFFSDTFRAQSAQIVESYKQRLLTNSAKGYIGGCYAIKALNYTDQLAQISAPTLAISGELDLSAPVAMGQVIASRIPAAQFFVIPGAGHVASAEQPEIFNAQVLKFLGH